MSILGKVTDTRDKDAEEKGIQDDRADRETEEWRLAGGVRLGIACVKAQSGRKSVTQNCH